MYLGAKSWVYTIKARERENVGFAAAVPAAGVKQTLLNWPGVTSCPLQTYCLLTIRSSTSAIDSAPGVRAVSQAPGSVWAAGFQPLVCRIL